MDGIAALRRLNRRLRDAALAGDERGLRSAISQGADVESGDQVRWDAAARRCGACRVHADLRSRAPFCQFRGNTALVLAAGAGHATAVATLIEAGAWVNGANKSGLTPLMAAAKAKSTACVRLLLDAGADTAAPGGAEATNAYGWAALRHDHESMALLAAAEADAGRVVAPKPTQNQPTTPRSSEEQVSVRPSSSGRRSLGKANSSPSSNVHGSSKGDGSGGGSSKGGARPPMTLHEAASRGLTKRVRYLVSKGASVNAHDATGYTPLILATINGHTECVRALLSFGASVDDADRLSGGTPVMVAALNGHEAAFSLLVERGACMSVVDHNGNTLLIAAAAGGSVPILKQTLAHEAASLDARPGGGVNCGNRDGMTPLIHACAVGHASVVDALLRAGADVAAVATDGESAVTAAARGGHTDALRLLLDHGADPNARCSAQAHGGRPTAYRAGAPIVLAARAGHAEVVRLLLDRGASVSPSDAAVFTPLAFLAVQHADTLKALLAAPGVSVCTPTNRAGDTLLALAASTADAPGVCEALLAAGSDVDVRNQDKRTPLMNAAANGHVGVLRCLARAGASLTAVDGSGNTAVHLAAHAAQATACRVLACELGAVCNTANAVGAFPLLLAARTGDVAAVQALTAAGASPQQAVHDVFTQGMPAATAGCTALHTAACHGHVDVIRVLAKLVPTVEPRCVQGHTPLHFAVMHSRWDAAAALVALKADVNSCNLAGVPLVCAAAESFHAHALKWLVDHGANVAATRTSDERAALHIIQLQAGKSLRRYKYMVKLLLRAGGDVNQADADGKAPLHLAVRSRVPASVRVLLDHGAHPDARDAVGNTPMMFILGGGSRNPSTFLVDALLSSGSDANAANNAGHSVLMFAASAGSLKNCAKLVSAGADVAAVAASDGDTPLLAAASAGKGQVCEFLLRKGAPPGSVRAVRLCVCFRGDRGLMRVGAPVDMCMVCDRLDGWCAHELLHQDGSTPLIWCAWHGHATLVKALLEAGADPMVSSEVCGYVWVHGVRTTC